MAEGAARQCSEPSVIPLSYPGICSWLQAASADKQYFFLKWANPGLVFIYFCLLKHTLQILQQIGM